MCCQADGATEYGQPKVATYAHMFAMLIFIESSVHNNHPCHSDVGSRMLGKKDGQSLNIRYLLGRWEHGSVSKPNLTKPSKISDLFMHEILI